MHRYAFQAWLHKPHPKNMEVCPPSASSEEKTVEQADTALQDTSEFGGNIGYTGDVAKSNNQAAATVTAYKTSLFPRTFREWSLLACYRPRSLMLHREQCWVGLDTVPLTLQQLPIRASVSLVVSLHIKVLTLEGVGCTFPP